MALIIKIVVGIILLLFIIKLMKKLISLEPNLKNEDEALNQNDKHKK